MITRRNRACLLIAAGTAIILPMALTNPAVADSATTAAAAVSPREFTPIEDRYWGDPALRKLLGNPVDTEYTQKQISYQQFERGWLYYSKDTGVHEIHDDIARKFVELGGFGSLGVPMTDETSTPDGAGRFNYFTGTKTKGVVGIYWHPETGAHGIWGPNLDFWAKAGHETGYLSYPTSSTGHTSGNVGLTNHFRGDDRAGASVFWTEETGAHSVGGEIRRKWAELGWENALGYPTNNETPTSDGQGRYNTFTGTEDPPAAIYWHPRTGAHHMRGTIYRHYTEKLGAERSYLGYPTSDPYLHPETRDTWVNFEGGYIRVEARSGRVVDGRW